MGIEEEKTALIRRVSIEVFVVISTSVTLTLVTTLVGFMENLVRLEENTNVNTETIREIKQDVKNIRKELRNR